MIDNKGFTLIEMVITMALVIVVIMITGSAFESILKSTGRLVSSEESNIEGVVGLEMFRHDLQQAGYGIPGAYLTPAPTYTEAASSPANLSNDAPNGVPRAIVSLESLAGVSDTNAGDGVTYSLLDDTDYLAIKATTVGRSQTAKKWTFLTYSAASGTIFGKKAPHRWPSSADNFINTDRVIVLKRTFLDNGTPTNTLIFNNNNTGVPSTYWPDDPTVLMSDNFNPGSTDPTYYLYGVDAGDLRMPFNRADYFVASSVSASRPSTCAPNTGSLYKATVDHADGKLDYMPLLDCVANMQIVFGWDINGDGVITESSAYSSDAAQISVSGTASGADIKAVMLDPTRIRNTLKYIKVYVMVQEGRKDLNFRNTNTLANNTYSVVVGDANSSSSNINLTKGYTAAELETKGWLNYRWKTYRIVVKPNSF